MAVIDNWFIVTFHGRMKARFPINKLQQQDYQVFAKYSLKKIDDQNFIIDTNFKYNLN
ncbi:hypothetical protein CLV48_105146 [Cecembia rubra]|uniref:Uncharacterized protein n=1 Tax=Cecembia rubra TaxID=1485585 RepID=A0A2P8E4K8_9BACT|nr:hypothetical protein CLV48_105146 [Cecembia rubra]